MTMKCIAVDDEGPALYLIEDNIRRVPFLHLVKCCKNAYDAMVILQQESIDLMFLDIEMPGITGLEFLQSLPSKPMVIFTTAYKKYAWEGYNLDVLDYLLKPIAYDRFLKAVNKAHEYYHVRRKEQSEAPVNPDYIFVYAEYNLVKIVLNEITHIEALKDYVKIYLNTSNKPVITRVSMKAMEEKLPASKYVRVHKSFIVSIDKITSIRKNRINLGLSDVPMSDNFRENIFKLIDIKT
jgi:DNA-binding LytR/AlgR family response regulator